MMRHTPRSTVLHAMTALALAMILSVSTAVAAVGTGSTRALYEKAYVYGLPIIMSYKTLYFYAVDEGGPQYKAPFNRIKNTARVYGPKDTTVVSPNSDTPYSLLWLDLRAEPVVLCVPKIEDKRYYSVMLQDLSTNLLPYIGSRTTGNDSGCFMVAGPDWNGETPHGIDQTIEAATRFVFTVYRTQLFDAADIDKVKKVQSEYSVQPLSAYAKADAPASPAKTDFPKWDEQGATGNDFIAFLNFNLQFIQPTDAEKALLGELEAIGVGAGKAFSFDDLPPDRQAALTTGVAATKNEISAKVALLPAVRGDSAEGYGSDWLQRAATTQLGWGANSRKEAMYPTYAKDADGDPLGAGKSNYALTFPEDRLPPVKAFWSLTLYDAKSQLMIENPINRYLLNSTMVEDMVTGDDGSISLYIQKDAPDDKLKANWLPAPDGPFYMLLRLYRPEKTILDGDWKQPPVIKAD